MDLDAITSHYSGKERLRVQNPDPFRGLGPWTGSIFWWTQSMDQGSMFCTLPRKGAHTSKPNSRERGNSSLKTEMRVFLLLIFFGCTLEDTLAVKKSGVSSSTPEVRPEPLIYTHKQVDKHQWPFYMGFPFVLLYYFSQPKLVHFRKKNCEL